MDSPDSISESVDSLPQPTLIIYSHGRNPPLHPAPDLKYDLRNIPNPPKALRDISDGRSKRLREHLLSETKFMQRLGTVEQDILNAMKGKVAEHAAQVKVPELPGERQSENRHTPEAGDVAENSTANVEPQDEEVEETSSTEDEGITLRVGCNCVLGRHRSVAFVEELARRPWPKEWQVHVVHRDLEKKRSGGARARQKASFREKRREMWEQ